MSWRFHSEDDALTLGGRALDRCTAALDQKFETKGHTNARAASVVERVVVVLIPRP